MRPLSGSGRARGCGWPAARTARTWRVEGPHFLMSEVLSLLFDTRSDPTRLLVGFRSSHWGPSLQHSDDLGATWVEHPDGSIRFPEDTDTALKATWQLVADPHDPARGLGRHASRRGCGAAPTGGETFELNRGLWEHPHRPEWGEGFGGGRHPHRPAEPGRRRPHARGDEHRRRLQHPRRRRVVGAGQHRHPRLLPAARRVARVRPVRAQGGPRQRHPDPALRAEPQGRLPLRRRRGHLDLDRGGPADQLRHDRRGPPEPGRHDVAGADRLRRRAHPAGGRAAGAAHRRRRGDLAHPARRGCRHRSYTNVLRDAAGLDTHDEPGLYFGTRNGEVYASVDGGESFARIAEQLPDVLCVRAVTLS